MSMQSDVIIFSTEGMSNHGIVMPKDWLKFTPILKGLLDSAPTARNGEIFEDNDTYNHVHHALPILELLADTHEQEDSKYSFLKKLNEQSVDWIETLPYQLASCRFLGMQAKFAVPEILLELIVSKFKTKEFQERFLYDTTIVSCWPVCIQRALSDQLCLDTVMSLFPWQSTIVARDFLGPSDGNGIEDDIACLVFNDENNKLLIKTLSGIFYCVDLKTFKVDCVFRLLDCKPRTNEQASGYSRYARIINKILINGTDIEITIGDKHTLFKQANFSITELAIDNKDSMLLGCCHEGIIIWDIATQKQLHKFTISSSSLKWSKYSESWVYDTGHPITNSTLSESYHCSSSGDSLAQLKLDFFSYYNKKQDQPTPRQCTIRLRLLTFPDEILQKFEHGHYIYNAGFNHKDTKVISASYDKTAKLWDTKTGRCEFTFVHDNPVMLAIFNNDGSLIATYSNDTVYLWHQPLRDTLYNLSLDQKLLLLYIAEYADTDKVLSLSVSAMSLYLSLPLEIRKYTDKHTTLPESNYAIFGKYIGKLLHSYAEIRG